MTGKPLSAELTSMLHNSHTAFADAVSNYCGELDGEFAVYAEEGFRQAVRLSNAGHLMHLEADPAYPLLIKMQSLQRQMMLPSADAVYHFASLHSDYSYRLVGQRGSAHLFQIAIYQGSSARYPDFELSCDRDSLSTKWLRPGRDIELVLDANKRPELGEAHLLLPEGECELHIRQYYYDWDTEQAASLWLEREHADYPPPSVSPGAISARAEQMNSWLRVQSALAKQYVTSFFSTDADTMNVIEIPGAFAGTRYLNGHFQCKADDAVILEVEPPYAVYWGFQLSNFAWEALDYYRRQTSINGHQAAIDSDGMFRAVISQRDPGVANWLDAGGREIGLISGRYFQSENAPVPKLTRVPFAELMTCLPKDTPRITKMQRAENISERWRSAHRRTCSDQ
ncbi:MAG: hypothetical protein AAF542_04020 [Pseudomonadota bacterium]